jgi:hypothetical protein
MIGVILMVLGIAYFFATGQKSFTALIPAFFGLPLFLLGLLALQEKFLKHAMHAAAVVGLLGFLGGVFGAVRSVVKEGAIENPAVESALLALVCAVFVGLCVQSFIAARRRRAQAVKG